MIKSLGILLVIPLLLSVGPMAPAKIRMGIIPFAPYYYTNSDGKQAGWIYEEIKRITKVLDRQLVTSDLSPSRAIKELSLGNIDFLVAISSFKNLRKFAHVGSKVIAQIKLTAFSREGVSLMKSYQDLVGKSLIILQGYNYGGLAKFIRDPENKVDYHVVESHEIGLRMMRHNRADYFLAYKGPTEIALKQTPIPNLQHSIIKSLDLHFIFSKKLDGSKEILDKFEKLYSKGNLK